MVFCNWLGVEMVMSMGQVYEMGILIFKLSISQVLKILSRATLLAYWSQG